MENFNEEDFEQWWEDQQKELFYLRFFTMKEIARIAWKEALKRK